MLFTVERSNHETRFRNHLRKNKSHRFIFQTLIWMLAGIKVIFPSVQAGSVYLVEDGQPRAVVVTADDPSPTAEYAAEELVYHVELATGVSLPLAPESDIPDGYPHRVFIGPGDAAGAAGLKVDSLKLEAALMRVMDKNLFILGRENDDNPLSQRNTHAGTLFGVYELLENTLQARWLWPGELGTNVPCTETVKVSSDLDTIVEPVFNPRHITLESIYGDYFSSNQVRNDYRHDLNVYLRRHRIGRSYINPECPCHHLSSLYAYARENPEDAPWYVVDEEGRESLCVSHPELHRMIVERHDEFDSRRVWRDFGDGRIHIMLGDIDSRWHPCRCEECKKWDGPLRQEGPVNPATQELFEEGFYERFGRMHTADRYARLAKTIYEMARERYPDAEILMSNLLYWTNLFVPTSDIELNSDFFGYFCPWGMGLEGAVWFPIGEVALEWKKEQWLGWRETGMSLIHRPNHWFEGYVMPHVERQGGEFFQWAYQNDMVGFYYTRLIGHWATQGRNIYMYMRLFNHPEEDIDVILEEYYSSFGPAAEPVRRYFEYWEDYTHERKQPLEPKPGMMFGKDYKLTNHILPLDHNPMYTSAAAAADVYPEKFFGPAQEMLAEAMDIARQHPYSKYADRVEFLQLGLEHALLASRFTGSMEVESAVRSSVPEDAEARQAALEAFAELEEFRHRHGDSYIANFGNAMRRLERRPIRGLEELREELEEKEK